MPSFERGRSCGSAHPANATQLNGSHTEIETQESRLRPGVAPLQAEAKRAFSLSYRLFPTQCELMRRVPKGKLTTIDELRKALAKRHNATIACPITTGIFAWIAAHAAVEAEAEGKKRTTPYWRTLKSVGELNPKYPGGITGLKRKLEAEGHKVVRKGRRSYVDNFRQSLWIANLESLT